MGVYREQFWQADYAGLGLPRQLRRSGTYRTYTPHLLRGRDFKVSPDAAAALREAERVVVSLEASLATRQEAGRAPLAMLRFLEAIGSSAMEGYRSVAARLVATKATNGVGAEGADLKILGNLAVIERAHALADAGGVVAEDLVGMQAELMNERGESELVGIRDEQNWIGGSDYHPLDAVHVPPPPDDVTELMRDLCEYVSLPSTDSPLLRAAIAHAQLETIHPFLDGNGRVGRALVHLMLRREGLTDLAVLPLSGTWGKGKGRYVDFLNAMRTEGEWGVSHLDRAAHYIAQTVIEAAQAAFSIAASVQQVEEQIRERVAGAFRADSVAHRIVPDVGVALGVTADGIAQRHGVDAVAALRALSRMEELGILKRRSAQRPHVFYSPAMLRLVEKFSTQIPEGDEGRVSLDSRAESVATVAVGTQDQPPRRERCGAWMPRARTHCALPRGHSGWPDKGHRQQ